MADVIVVVDDQGQLVSITRHDPNTTLSTIRENMRAQRVFQSPQTLPFTPGEEVYVFKDVQNLIDSSPHLNAQQRQEAQAVFDSFSPGDRFIFGRGQPIIRQHNDAPNKPKPLIFVFVDP